MIRRLIAPALFAAWAAALAGCAVLTPDPFAVRMSDMGYMAKMDETYRIIPLQSDDDRTWFDGQLRALYDGRIDKARFVAEGDRRIPGHAESWRRLADLFAR